MSFVDAIARKRDGGELDGEQIAELVGGASRGDLPPEQLAAMLMAICCRGMSPAETARLTDEMLRSGQTWDLAADRPDAIDKHSTGGIGDTVSLLLAPWLASVGVPVAMMAGRGLGHSQGTLDKLEAVPGFDCRRDRRELLRLLDDCGAAIVAQTEDIAPADRTLYALRDVTATVPSLPLIVASIMSKKLALGARTLLLDVKWGSGAFRPTVADATELGRALRSVARDAGTVAEALVTDMNQPLGSSLGTACEVRQAVAALEGGGSPPLVEVTLRLAVEAMALAGCDRAGAEATLRRALDDGTARAAWDRLVVAHGGDPDVSSLPRPRARHRVTASRSGWVTSVDGSALGRAAADLGAGRRRRDEPLDHGAGLDVGVRIGDRVEHGEELATLLLGGRPVDVTEVAARVAAAIAIGDEPVDPPRLILGTVDEVDGQA